MLEKYKVNDIILKINGKKIPYSVSDECNFTIYTVYDKIDIKDVEIVDLVKIKYKYK